MSKRPFTIAAICVGLLAIVLVSNRLSRVEGQEVREPVPGAGSDCLTASSRFQTTSIAHFLRRCCEYSKACASSDVAKRDDRAS